jgi:3-deoxy-7-phosphoheptulonate synthase
VVVVVRAFLEKPRTGHGWRGWFGEVDGQEMERRLRLARSFFLELVEFGLPVAVEFLDPLLAPYLEDLVTWGAIGARTVTAPGHRLLASGLSCPVGFKNPLDGDLMGGVRAIALAQMGHHYPAMDEEGGLVMHESKGNRGAHLVLRGGSRGPNYDAASLQHAKELLIRHSLPPYLLVDCAHGNSRIKPDGQIEVWQSVLDQRRTPGSPIVGALLESYLVEGSSHGIEGSSYGMSVTDPCLGWERTQELLEQLL